MPMFRDKTHLTTPDQALPGHREAMPVTNRHFVKGTPIQPPFPADIRTALFGFSCFWGTERCFWELPGVYSTAVGYAADHTLNPTYQEVCSGLRGTTRSSWWYLHRGTSASITLLRRFWEAHDPTQSMRQGNDVGTQYRSRIYVTDD